MTVRILIGDVLAKLAELPDESVHCVVTSPPYWGLRDYGVVGQLGLEPTLPEHIAVMVDVFRAVRRVMRKDATLWLNYGDCYATSPNGRSAADTKAAGNDDRTFRDKPFSTIGGVLKAKDLCMIPNRLAIALQEDGWWVRSEIIWGKTNPMPDSVKDRPATSHEKIFLLSKSARYFYDIDAVRRERTSDEDANGFRGGSYVDGAPGPRKIVGNHAAVRGRSTYRQTPEEASKNRTVDARHQGHINHTALDGTPRGEGRNLRNWEPAPPQVWQIATRAFAEAHFATFPPELAERCISAGCPKGGTVLDPFFGAGTTGLVADRLERDCIGIELNPDYAEMARHRIAVDGGMFARVAAE